MLGALAPFGIITGSVSAVAYLPKWAFGILMLRIHGGNGCGLWFAATGIQELANYLGIAVTVTVVDNQICITSSEGFTIDYKLFQINILA